MKVIKKEFNESEEYKESKEEERGGAVAPQALRRRTVRG